MYPHTNPTIKQAIKLLKSGHVDSARSLLITILKENPNSETAWYLLSLLTNETDRQIYALKRALSIKSDFPEAKDRLNKIIGMDRLISSPPLTKEASEGSIKTALQIKTGEEKPKVIVESPITVHDDDLLSQRIFGQPSLTKKLVDKKSANQISIKDRFFAFVEGNPIFDQLSQFLKSNRKTIFYILIILMILIAGYFVWSQLFHARLDNNPDSATTTTNQEIAANDSIIDKVVNPTSSSQSPQGSEAPANPILPSISSTHLNQTATLEFNYIETPEPLLREQKIKLTPIQSKISSKLSSNTSPPDFSTAFIPELDFNTAIESSLNTPHLLDKAALDKITYELFGLYDPVINLQDHYMNAWAEPEGGFYDPVTNSIFISGNEINEDRLSVYAFEYAQAIIDKQIKIENSGVFPYCQISNDRCQAMLALIKGAAAIVQQDIVSTENQEDIENSIDVSPPSFTSADLAFPYVAGYAFFEYLINEYGNTAIRNALSYPPISTEQVLHPEKYIYKEVPLIVHNISLSVALGDNWALINSDTLGEWKTYLYLAYTFDEKSGIADSTAREAAKGWGGDQFLVYQNDNTGKSILCAHWIWDSPSEAEEFSSAIVEKFNLQYDTSKFTYQNAECWESAERSDSVCLVSKNYQYYLIVAPDLDTSSKLATYISTQ